MALEALRALPDEVVLAEAATGDQYAWDCLVSRYTKLVWSAVRSYRLDAADAADAVQTTWLRLVEHLDRLEDPERLAGWLVTTVRRECLRILRRQSRETPHAPDASVLDSPDPAEPVDSGRIRADRDAQLWAAFERLPDRCQQLLRVLMSSPSPSYGTVSQALSIPVGSIGSARARCLARLRMLLNQTEALPAVWSKDRSDRREP
jgi:RNA polymerase sigma factor (sigma-70 family)